MKHRIMSLIEMKLLDKPIDSLMGFVVVILAGVMALKFETSIS